MSEIVDCIAWIVQKTCWSFYVFCKFICLRFLDLLGLIFNILACLTIVRLPCMVAQFRDMKRLSEWRFVGFVQLMIFLMDIPFIIMGLTILALSFGLLSFRMAREIEEKRIKSDYTRKNSLGVYYGGFKLRKIVAKYFFKHMSGILCIPSLLITLLSWRSLILVRKLRCQNYLDWKWRKEILVQFFQLFIDIPCVFVAAFVVLSWRLPFYIRSVKKVKEEEHGWSRWRFVAFKHFALLFADLFCFVFFLLTFVTWRSPFMIIEFRDDCNSQWKARYTVIKQFLLIFVDIPCIFCFVFVLITLWRQPRFVKNIKYDQWEIRRNCVYQAGMVLVDFACFLLFSVVLLTLWRVYPLFRDIRKYRTRAHLSVTETAEASTSDSHGQPRVISRPSSWKIRKSICKHFALLFIDLPAIVVLLFIFLTIFRVPSLVSKLLQSGDFYAEFAMIVFIEAGKLVVDIIFVLFFIVLIIMRPVASWVRLLEDEEHALYRHARFYIKWVPDMVRDTKTMLPIVIEEEFSSCLKARIPAVQARVRMSVVCQKYLKQLEWLRGKVQENDAYPELLHLITTILWYEKRRPYKMSRLYSCELLYLLKPVPSAHDETLSKHRREMAEYEERVTSAYKDLERFTPSKVPLWTNKCGLLTRSRRETQKVVLGLPGGNIFLFILVFFNLLLVYRGPKLLLDLFHRWYDRRSIIFRSCKEYFLDALTFLRILVVVLLVYRAPALILDITIDLFQKQSWKAVRATAERYPPEIIDDFARLISNIFTWRSVRFIFTAVLFGILIPADLLLTVLKLALSKEFAFVIAGILYAAYLAFPFALAFHFGEELLLDGFDEKITYIVGGFGLSIVLLLVLLIIVLLRHRGVTFSVAPKPYDYIRLNWANAHVIIFEIVELLQLLALVFSIDGIPMAGSGVLNTFSNYLLFNFASFEVKLSLTAVGFFIWFIACGAPVIFEHILEEFSEGTCASNGGWRLLMVLFSNTLFVSMVEGLSGLVACEYTNCTNNGTLSGQNNTRYMSTLIDDKATNCWVGTHRIIALFGLWGLFWYTTTSIIYGTQYGEVDNPNVDIEFSPVYNTMMNFLKALMIGAVVLFPNDFHMVMTCLLVLSVIAIILTVFFRKLVGYDTCNSAVVYYFRVASFFVLAFTVVAALIAKSLDDEDSYVPVIVFFAGVGGTLFVASVVSVLLRRETSTEIERKQFRETLLVLEKRLNGDRMLVHSWKVQKLKWRRLVRHVYEAQELDRNVSAEMWEGIALPESHVDPATSSCPPTPTLSTEETPFNPPPPPIDSPGASSEEPLTITNPKLSPSDIDEPATAENQPPTNEDQPLTNEDKQPVIDYQPATNEDQSPINEYRPPDNKDQSPANQDQSSMTNSPLSADEGTPLGTTTAPETENYEPDSVVSSASHDSEGVNPETADTDTIICDPDPEIYDLDEFLSRETYEIQRLNDYRDSHETTTMTNLQCNGKNVLLFFEEFIHYRAFSYAFVSQIPVWRQAVTSSNWTGLMHCLHVLEKALTGNYNKPTELDVALGDKRVPTCTLLPDLDQGIPPEFVPEPHDPESIKHQSDEQREKALGDIQRLFPDEPLWVTVFEKVLPTIPVIRKWTLDEESNSFDLVLRRSCLATIVDVGPKGIKLAKGAMITLPKHVKGVLTKDWLMFQKHFEPIGKKGPISVAVLEVQIVRVSDKVYLYSNGKKINMEKALDSLKSVNWS